MLACYHRLRGVAFVSPESMSNINCIKGMEFGKKRPAKDGGGINQQRLAPALRKNGQNAEPTSENAESDRLLALKNEERSIRKQFNEQMKAMQEAFEKRIAEKRHEIEEARAVIRSKGDVEPDSLLFVGADLILKALLYLKPRKMFRLGVVCKCFEKATHLCLVGMDSMTAECDRADEDKSVCPSDSQIELRIDQKLAVAAAEEERGDDNSSSTNSDDLASFYRCRGEGGGGSSSSDESDSTEESDSGSDDNASM